MWLSQSLGMGAFISLVHVICASAVMQVGLKSSSSMCYTFNLPISLQKQLPHTRAYCLPREGPCFYSLCWSSGLAWHKVHFPRKSMLMERKKTQLCMQDNSCKINSCSITVARKTGTLKSVKLFSLHFYSAIHSQQTWNSFTSWTFYAATSRVEWKSTPHQLASSDQVIIFVKIKLSL